MLYIVIIFLIALFFLIKKESVEKIKYKDKQAQMGDDYERQIGLYFEKKGDLVIYNGLIFGLQDEGVDLVCISSNEKHINLVQCKNWHKKQMTLEDLENIYLRLKWYQLNFSILRFDYKEISRHLSKNISLKNIEKILKNCSNFRFRKTLYMTNDNVMNFDIEKELKKIKPYLYTYKDMMIIIIKNRKISKL